MIKKDRIGTMFIKPGYFPNDPPGTPFQKNIESLIASFQIEILDTEELILTIEQIERIYHKMFNQQNPSPILIQIKKDLVDYLSKAPIFCYLLHGEEVRKKTEIIKKGIRYQYGFMKGSTNVKNILHTPENDDVMLDVSILFPKRSKELDEI